MKRWHILILYNRSDVKGKCYNPSCYSSGVSLALKPVTKPMKKTVIIWWLELYGVDEMKGVATDDGLVCTVKNNFVKS